MNNESIAAITDNKDLSPDEAAYLSKYFTDHLESVRLAKQELEMHPWPGETAEQTRSRYKYSNIPVDLDAEWTCFISDEDMATITPDQQLALDELKANGIIKIPTRYAGGDQADMRRAKIFKTLGYKDLCTISVSRDSWTFADRDEMGRL